MKIKEFNQSKIPLVKIDKRLNTLKGKILFKEKLEMANKLLDNAVFPKSIFDKKHN